jgi:uncharacterized membrane protein
MRKRLFRFFFPPAESSWLRRYFPWSFVIAVPAIILLVIPPAWEYSNSPKFCGTTCHTMPPEYQTYQVSPHARVLCVDCHIGRDSVFTQVSRKSEHMTLLYKTATGNYEFPIRAGSMRPARDTCERCHYPQKFSDDSLRVIHRFENDEDNTPYAIYLLMHTGGGSQREGLGRGIHWHIENPIEYIALDPEEQEIPWVRVNTAEGETMEYLAEDADIDTDNLDQYDIHEMDCITCHNRISHLIKPPRSTVDAALYRGDLSADIPFIREKAVDILAESYDHEDEALAEIASLDDYYREEYSEFYDENEQSVKSALELLAQLYEDNTFPDQELDWQTHPNNIGHRDSPGCFRCHDGEHFNEAGEAIRLECNLCHAIPEVVRPTEIEPMLPLTTGIEPSSHLDSTWISRHHNEINQSCANCHTIANPGGTTDESFCSNSACHGTDWEYAGFDAPALAVELGLEPETEESETAITVETGESITYQLLQPVFEENCGACHGANPTKGLTVTDYDSLLAGGEDGPVIVPGDPDESLILQILSADHFAKLTDEQMGWLEQWIADGAPEGKPPAESGSDETTDTDSVQAPPVLDQELAQPITYETLQPVLAETCGKCHGEMATKGLNVTTYDTLMTGGEDGAVIAPGKPDESLILQKLTEGHYAQLTDEQMALLEQWITDGAPESAESEAAPAETDTEAMPEGTPEASGSAAEAVTYADLQPILAEMCGACHGEAATKGLNVTTYDTLMAGGEDGAVIAPGKPDESLILQKLTEGHYAQLTDDQMALLEQWITDGASEGDAVASESQETEMSEDSEVEDDG